VQVKYMSVIEAEQYLYLT